MSDTFYAEMREVADEILEEFAQGEVLLVRSVPGTPDPDRPWLPGLPGSMTYRLSATVSTVSKKFVDGTLVVGTEEAAVAAVTGTHIATDGVAVPPVAVSIAPTMDDSLIVDGRPRKIKKAVAIPSAGEPVAYVLVMEG